MYQINFAAVSNAADWTDTLEVTSEDDASLVDLTGWSFTIHVRPANSTSRTLPYGYPGTNLSGGAILTGTTADGTITNPSLGVIQWTFRAAQMASVPAGYYDVGMTMTNGTETLQLITGTLPVQSGVIIL